MKQIQYIKQTIGNTPLISLDIEKSNISLFVKLETHNFTGSIKDRMALHILQKAFKTKKLKRNSTIVEATTGNTGISFAALGASYGLKTILVMPDNSSKERVQMMKIYGAQVILTPQSHGPIGAIKQRNAIASQIKNSWIPDQFNNPENTMSHSRGIAEEIIKQTDANIDYFVHGVGTGGTLMGIAKKLKMVNPNIKIVALEPEESAVMSGKKLNQHGIQGIGEGFIPSLVNLSLIDMIITVSTKQAINESKILARKYGILVGISSGANIAAIKKLDKLLHKKSKVLTIFADRGERYLSVY